MSQSPVRTWLIRGVIGVVAAGLLGLLALVGLGAWSHEARPDMTAGPEAEALADRMLTAVDAEAWERTGAVTWRLRDHVHLWDRKLNRIRVSQGDVTVWMDLGTRRGVAHRNGKRVQPGEEQGLLDWAYALWANDSFWLNPVVKIRDGGTSRGTVARDGGTALMVSYSSGGVTPGDSYLWHIGEDGRPTRWEMWVGIIPVGGVDVTWEGWRQLPTGAWVAPEHDWGLFRMALEDIDGAETLEGLGAASAFDELEALNP